MANESADNLAVWTGDQLEALDKGLPFFDAAIKPALLDHVAPSAKNVIVAEGGRSGVAGYDKNPRSGVRGKDAEELCQIVGVTNIRRSDDKSATLRLKCDQSEVRDIYNAAPQVQKTLVVTKAGQTITFTAPTSPITFVPNKTVTLSASASSGAVVTFSIDASSTGSGSISGNVLTITGVGTIVLNANQAGNSNYNAAPQVQKTLVVTKAGQTIAFTPPTSPITFVPKETVTLSASASSGASVAFTIDSSSTGSGTISGTVLTITGAGSFVLDANQAGNSNYNAAPQVQHTLVVSKASQTITFTAPTSPITFAPNKTVTLSASASSGASVAFSIDSSSTGSGTISGTVLTITGAGSFVIDANQAGNSNYNPATQVQQTLVVNKASQTITFTAPTSPILFVANEIVNLSASAGSGAPVAFSIDSSSTGSGTISGTISGTVLTITGAGSIVIDANQAGNSNYNAAPQVQQTLSSSSSLPWTQFPAVVQLNVGSPHGLPIAFTSSVVAVSQLYDVQQALQVEELNGSYYTGMFGGQAKWLYSTTVNQYKTHWYNLLPDGTLHAWNGSTDPKTGSSAGAVVATLSTTVYADPSLLINALPPIVNYNLLYTTEQSLHLQELSGYHTGLYGGQAKWLYSTTVNQYKTHWYNLLPDGTLHAYNGSTDPNTGSSAGVVVATLDRSVYINPGVLLDAQAPPVLCSQLYAVQQQLDLEELGGSYHTGMYGSAAEWLYSVIPNQYGLHWYNLLKNGTLHAWNGSANANTGSSAGAVVATVDASVYTNPQYLLDAVAEPAPAVNITVAPNPSATGTATMTIALPANYIGAFHVTVGTSDGVFSNTQSFPVAVTDSALRSSRSATRP